MKILVTGANGFLGQHLVKLLLSNGFSVLATGRGPARLVQASATPIPYQSLDFTSREETLAVFRDFQPDMVIHTAAMSKPDECALFPEQAYTVNVKGTLNLLEAGAVSKAHFIFLSTDFIFDGEKGMYLETDPPAPVNYYGETKWEAEKKVQAYPADWTIIRTVLVYGPNYSGRKNIIDIVKEKLQQGEPYSVVDDQLRTPTFVEDLAGAILKLIEKKANGIFHVAGEDMLSPYAMACRVAAALALDSSLLKRVNASVFTEPARRPLKTGLNISKATTQLGYQPLSFDEGLRRTLDQK